MDIDMSLLEEYPFNGSFYTYGVDESKPLEEQHDEEILVLETECDIQEVTNSDSGGNITASFEVFFPFDKSEGIAIKRGMIFKGNMYGLDVNGEVVGVFPTQLGGCTCYIKDRDV